MGNSLVRRSSFYGVLTLALVVLVTRSQHSFLPEGLASQIGHNSEALLFALLVCAGFEVRTSLREGHRRPVLWAAGALLVVLGVLLVQSDLTSSVRTLNEPLIGGGLVLAYTTLPRSPRVGLGFALVVLAFIVVFFDTALVLDQAESLVPLLLAGPALDVVDLTILQPEAEARPGLRWAWMAGLACVAIGFMVTAPWAREDLAGPLRLGIDYGQRAAEAYWGWILVHGYFGVWLEAARRRQPADGRHRETTAA